MKELEVFFRLNPKESILVGTLAEKNHAIYFEYGDEWIKRGIELSPFHLPLQAGLLEHRDRDFGPLPGIFDDSLPDGWGLLLMDRHFRQNGIDPSALSPLDRLSYLGDNTMGALTYYPPVKQEKCEDLLFDLHHLARHSHDLFAGKPVDLLPQLRRAGGSPGGARPKILVGWNQTTDKIVSGEDDLPEEFEHWIIKFSAREDAIDAGPVEYAYSKMAQAAGLNMPPTRLFTTSEGDAFFGVKRFDREKNRRYHIHTFGNLIQADFRIPCCDYADLLKATQILTKNFEDVLQVFRLMIFNVMSHNRDDHAKNFTYILNWQTGNWSFAPVYDLTYANGPGGEHTTTVAGEGKQPTRQNFMELAQKIGISNNQAETIIDEVSNCVGRWEKFADQAGVRRKISDTIGEKLNHQRDDIG